MYKNYTKTFAFKGLLEIKKRHLKHLKFDKRTILILNDNKKLFASILVLLTNIKPLFNTNYIKLQYTIKSKTIRCITVIIYVENKFNYIEEYDIIINNKIISNNLLDIKLENIEEKKNGTIRAFT